MKLKNIEIKDNYPLSIMLSGKSIWNKSDNGIINIERLLDRHSDSCVHDRYETPIERCFYKIEKVIL